ncbi:MAG: hypothetical protein J3K34DRAFT_432836 [Monoraphidium minutum]|nr:MAG: hypothetical protein J3K34DRAFT_432836 [Monoraphidium minutum]
MSRVGSPQHVRVLVQGAAQPAKQGGVPHQSSGAKHGRGPPSPAPKIKDTHPHYIIFAASQIDAPVRSPWGASRQAYRHKSLESWQIRESRGRTPYISPRSCRAVKLINMIYVIALLRSMMLCRCQAGAPRRRSLPGFRKTCRSPFQHAASDPFPIIFLVLSLHISLTR